MRCFTLRVLITPKTRDVSSDEKNRKVSGRTSHAQFTRSTIPSADADIQYSTYSCTVYETPIRPLARAEITWVKSWFFFFCCVRSHYKTPCEVTKIALWLAIFFVRSFGWNLVQLLSNFHPNFASFQAQWEWPYGLCMLICLDSSQARLWKRCVWRVICSQRES